MTRKMEESFRAERERERERKSSGTEKRSAEEDELYMLSPLLHLAFLQRQLLFPNDEERERESISPRGIHVAPISFHLKTFF